MNFCTSAELLLFSPKFGARLFFSLLKNVLMLSSGSCSARFISSWFFFD